MSARRYVELAFTLAPEHAAKAASVVYSFETAEAAVFIGQGGVTVAMPARSGPYTMVLTNAINDARKLLDQRIPGAVIIPVPWSISMVDHDLMEANLLQARDVKADRGPQADGQAAA